MTQEERKPFGSCKKCGELLTEEDIEYGCYIIGICASCAQDWEAKQEDCSLDKEED